MDTLCKGRGTPSFNREYYYFKKSPVHVYVPLSENIEDYLPQAIELHNKLVNACLSIQKAIVDGEVTFNKYGDKRTLTITKYSFKRNSNILSSVTVKTDYSSIKLSMYDVDFAFDLYDESGKTLYDYDRDIDSEAYKTGGVSAYPSLMRPYIVR
jgi:hypothetical protein